MVKLTKKIETIPHSPTLWANDLVHEKRGAGETVYHMGFGESPFPVPERLQKALGDAAGRCEYLKADGLDDLIETIKTYYSDFHDADYVQNCNVLIAPGSKLLLYALQMAIEGDLLMPVPSWVSYAPQAQMLGDEIVKVPTTLDDAGYHIDPEDLRTAIKNARAEGKNPSKIIINAPNNPAGLTIPQDELEPIAKVCREENIFIISDEIYGLVDFEHKYKTIAPHAPKVTAVTTGLSKHLSLGGWRVGIAFIPKEQNALYKALRGIISETWSCVSTPVQAACIEAYKGHKDIEDHIKACTEIHGLMNTTISEGLKALGITCGKAQGAFYNYPDFAPFRDKLAAHGITTSQDVHEHLLKQYNLATLPGSAFGAEPEVLTLRLSGCDYDGAEALKAYQNGEKLDRAFVEKHAPRVLKSIDIFGEFIAEVSQKPIEKAA